MNPPRTGWIHPIDRTAESVRLFQDAFGARPAGVWAAPGRVNVMGEHTDYNEGFALPSALPHRTFVAVRPRRDERLCIVSQEMPGMRWEGTIHDVGPGIIDGWAAYPGGVVWALRQDGVACPGLDIAVASSVPIAVGLSSSAALACGVALAVADIVGVPTDDAGRQRLARICMRAETAVAGAITGGMDQAASLRALAGRAMLLDCRTGAAIYTPLGMEDLEGETGASLLVIDTQAQHEPAEPTIRTRRRECETAASLLGVPALRDVDYLDPALIDLEDAVSAADAEMLGRRVRHVVTEIERVKAVVASLTHNDFRQVGELFTASHASLRDDFEVSCPQLDDAVDAALEGGALGARMTGAGLGGSVVTLVEDERRSEVLASVTERSAEKGYAPPLFIDAPASDGAARVA